MEMKELRTARDLRLIAKEPAGNYKLAADIDMAGESWTPVDFSGSLDGCGHTISNLRTEKCEERKNAGMFGVLSGTVKDLHLRDAYICGNGAEYAGVLAGTVTGSAEGCTVTGTLCACTGACTGAMAGKVSGTVIGGTALEAKTGPDEKYAATGLCADVQTEKGALVGKTEEGATVSGLWRDNTYRFERLSKTLQARREKAVSYMRSMATVQWRVCEGKLEYLRNGLGNTAVHYQLFEEGKTYQGLPYCHSGGGLARFLAPMAKKEGRVYITKPGLENGHYYVGDYAKEHGFQEKESFGFIQYMGNDCSSAVSWSWRQVSSVDIGEGGCYGRYSGDMIPTEENEKTYGILPVGGFFAGATDTRQVLAQVGETAIYEAFAKALRGDGLCGYDTSGHVLMISYDPMVIRDGAGEIEPHESFLVTIEQGGGFYDSKGEDNRFKADLPEPIQSSWRVDYQYRFFDMARKGNYEGLADRRKFAGCDHIYLPITMEALQKENTPAVTPRVWMEGSTVRSNFYIAATQMEGEPVFTQVSHDWHVFREFPVTAVDLAKTHDLQPGSYTAKIHLSNEQVMEVNFTV